MQKDIRATSLYREASDLYMRLRQPGTGQISDAAEVHTSPDGKHAVFSGAVLDRLEGATPTRVCQIELTSGAVRVLTFGPNVDRSPKFSPQGRHIAFLSDRHAAGDFQLYLLDRDSGAASATPHVTGWVEYLHWSPDGTRILLGVAGRGADVAGGQGAITSKQADDDAPSWMPKVDTGAEDFRWRSVWIYELAGNRVQQVRHAQCNVWEAVWCGDDKIAALVSPGPGEGLWYSACLHLLEISGGETQELYSPRDQLGCAAGSPSGEHVAVVEAVCSDRGIVAGELRLIETSTGTVRRIDTRGVDVTHIEWRSDRQMLLAGHREFETVVGLCDARSAHFTEVWHSAEVTTGGRYVTVSGLGPSGDCVLIGESFTRAPELAVIRQGEYCPLRSFDLGYAACVESRIAVERVSWPAPDGLEIQGWWVRPGDGALPLIMVVHGGPVWQTRPMWLGRRNVALLMLLSRGYSLFFPNPRGSSGRGQHFARQVVGDMGGRDALDCLAGLDHLVRSGRADPRRLGVTGVSYGGFMTSWMISQDERFAAAVSVAPVNNHVTQHLISNIPHFVSLFLADTYRNPHGKYFERSPIMHAHKVRTPTLNICGALDRCTPPEEAVQFHNALLENGVESELVIYPEEGHGVNRFPAAIDYAARVVSWFEEHMGA